MAISLQQREYATEHFTQLMKDMLEFPERTKHLSVEDLYFSDSSGYIIDYNAIQDGIFDITTTVDAIWSVYSHFETVLAQSNEPEKNIPENVFRILYNTPRTKVIEAYIETRNFLINNSFTCKYTDIEPETVTSERMRPTLYI